MVSERGFKENTKKLNSPPAVCLRDASSVQVLPAPLAIDVAGNRHCSFPQPSLPYPQQRRLFSIALSGSQLARIAGGTAIGIASMLSPLYIAEISPEHMRGRPVSLNQLAITIGILLSYVTGWALSFTGPAAWRWMFASMAIPSLFFFCALFAVPEGPRWLIKMRRDKQALAALDRSGEHESRLAEIKRALAEGANVKWAQWRKP